MWSQLMRQSHGAASGRRTALRTAYLTVPRRSAVPASSSSSSSASSWQFTTAVDTEPCSDSVSPTEYSRVRPKSFSSSTHAYSWTASGSLPPVAIQTPTAERIVMKGETQPTSSQLISSYESTNEFEEPWDLSTDVDQSLSSQKQQLHHHHQPILQQQNQHPPLEPPISMHLEGEQKVKHVTYNQPRIDKHPAAKSSPSQKPPVTQPATANDGPLTTSALQIKLTNHRTSGTRVNQYDINSAQGHLSRAIQMKDPEQGMKIFYRCAGDGTVLQATLLKDFFYFMAVRNPIYAYDVLSRFRFLYPKNTDSADMYARICDTIGNIFPIESSRFPTYRVVERIQRDLSDLDFKEYKAICYPKLLLSMLKLSHPFLGQKAGPLYNHMIENDYPLTPEYLLSLLSHSRYARHDDLPFAQILSHVVSKGLRPAPSVAINVLSNHFPFLDLEATALVLKAIIQLHTSAYPNADRSTDYRVDIGTLEQITVAAARIGNIELNLHVWDLMDLLGYEPTEGMYENTIQAFAMSYRQDDNVFIVLSEMEAKGIVPTRALICSVSRSIRFSVRRVDHAYRLLTSKKTKGITISVSSLNIILASCAELGDVDRAFATFDDFVTYGMEPNSDSYSFAFESLARSMSREMKPDAAIRRSEAPSRVDAANALLMLMEEKGISPCYHCIHQCAMLLLYVDDLDGASQFVVEALQRKQHVSDKTLSILSTENATAGNYELAQFLASSTSEQLNHLYARIDKVKKRRAELSSNASQRQEPSK